MMFTRRAWLAHCTALAATVTALPSAGSQQATILVVGDSLSAEYGLERGSGWVALLEQQLSRVAPLLRQHQPTHVILELGANDALRGLPLSMTQANLEEMARAAKAAGAKVLIVGMQLPPNYGRKYSDDFAALFAAVARQHGAALVPFLLKGVADVPQAESLFQRDRIHPRKEAQPTMLGNVWPVLRPLLPR
jgi:acyl-CoA thioesterase-1